MHVIQGVDAMSDKDKVWPTGLTEVESEEIHIFRSLGSDDQYHLGKRLFEW